MKPERVEMFCDRLIHENLSLDYYIWGFRADRAPLRILQKLKESGAISVSIGIESANPGVLGQIRKGESIEQITETVGLLRKIGLYPMCLFMIGNPGDTLDTVKETIRYIRKNRLYLVSFNMALPYPKTELWNFVEKTGTFLHQDFTRFHHYSKQPVFETRDFTAPERARAFKLCCRLERVQRLKFEIERKMNWIRRGDFHSLSWTRLKASVRRMMKYILDLVLERAPKEKF
jgi:radical SAM superfamily enzyme YgiQ (UPF0313 family)